MLIVLFQWSLKGFGFPNSPRYVSLSRFVDHTVGRRFPLRLITEKIVGQQKV